MGRQKQIKVGVDALTVARLTVRAEQAASSVSEYVRGLIVRDLSRAAADGDVAGEPLRSGTSSATVLPQLLELALVTGILVRAQLARAVGEEETRALSARAQEKAKGQLRGLLGTPQPESDLEPVS